MSLNKERRVLLDEPPLLVEGEPAEVWLQPREVLEEFTEALQVVLEELLRHEVGVAVVQREQGVDELLARADHLGRRAPGLLQDGDHSLGIAPDQRGRVGRCLVVRRVGGIARVIKILYRWLIGWRRLRCGRFRSAVEVI